MSSEPLVGPAGPGGGVHRDFDEAELFRQRLPMQCVSTEPHSPGLDATMSPLGHAVVAVLQPEASTWLRREEDLSRGGRELIQVLWQLAGRSWIRQGRQASAIEPGAWTVCDAGREFTIRHEPHAQCLLMLLPRAQCPAWMSAVDRLAGLSLSPGGPAQVARTLLCAVLDDRTAIDARSEQALLDSVIALLGHALQQELAQRHLPVHRRRVANLEQVQAYVMERLNTHSLTVESVAEAFGMSRRSLYNLFATVGVTPRDYIHSARLARARELLRDPAWRDAPIVKIAEQCGFADAAHFSRAFHAHHGAAPHAWRCQL